ncbi:ArsA family ATPase [candidate division TA06 bacterium]|uniref:ArsA family ATPase n=1 Tax=candidate division TA06 bacterium TaxID=2250710 RepID=A0A660S8X9_UNCT6|nr:MAG: ArsA family ATPase [candidate division TA06 bacterium]
MKYIFFMGKGGVGKSTLSSLIAYKLAKRGEKTVLISLDFAHNLGDIFNMKIGNKGVRLEEHLDIFEPDIDRWVEEYLRNTRVLIKENYKYVSVFNLDNMLNLMKNSPGIEEYAILHLLYEKTKALADMDYLVVDMPPTALALRIFALPFITREWLKTLLKLRKEILVKRERIANVHGKEKFDFAVDEHEDKVYRNLKEQEEENAFLLKLIQGANIIPVTLPVQLSFKETERILKKLSEFKLNVPFVIVNRVKNDEWKKGCVCIEDKEVKTFDDFEREIKFQDFDNIDSEILQL